MDAWKEYLDHLNNKAEDESVQLWVTQGDELFINLLYAVALDIGYKFDRVQLKRGAYSPRAHGDLEAESAELRRATLSLLTGQHPLKMNVVALPMDPDAVAANRAAIQNLGKALETGILRVRLASTD